MVDGDLSSSVMSRDQWVSFYLRCVRMRNPNAKTGPDDYYGVQARNFADLLLVLSAATEGCEGDRPADGCLLRRVRFVAG